MSAGSEASYTTESSAPSTQRVNRKSCWSCFVRWIRDLPVGPLMIAIRVLNVILALLLIAVYPFAFATDIETVKKSMVLNVMLMLYCTGFSIMLVVFEARVARMDKRMNHLFGFMFSFLGRAFFLCFLGTLAIAGGGAMVFSGSVGGVAIAFGIVQCIIMYNHPAFQVDGELSNRSSRLQGSYSTVDQAQEGGETEGPVISIQQRLEPGDLGRDDLEGEVGDDPFHVNQGVTHFDDEGELPRVGEAADAGMVSISLETPGEKGGHSSKAKAVSQGVVEESPDDASDDSDADVGFARAGVGNEDDDEDDSDMENPFAE